jgi:hypothetical protein
MFPRSIDRLACFSYCSIHKLFILFFNQKISMVFNRTPVMAPILAPLLGVLLGVLFTGVYLPQKTDLAPPLERERNSA